MKVKWHQCEEDGDDWCSNVPGGAVLMTVHGACIGLTTTSSMVFIPGVRWDDEAKELVGHEPARA